MPIPTKIKDLIPLLELIPHPEGGFFVETFRSGCKPMTTLGQSGLDDCCEEPDRNLVVTKGRADKRPDKDERRNSLTSIFWVVRLHFESRCQEMVQYPTHSTLFSIPCF